MNVLFAHDHWFKTDGVNYFSSGCFPKSVWHRYTSILGSLTVVGRHGGVIHSNDENHTLSSGSNVKFHLFENLTTIKNFFHLDANIKSSIASLVSQNDLIICRLPSRLGHLFLNEAERQEKVYAIEVVGCPWDALWNYGGFKAKLYAPLSSYMQKRALRRTFNACYVTKSFLQRRYPARSGSLMVGISDVCIPSVSEQVLYRRLRKYTEAKKRTFKVGLIGNYQSNYKGIDIAIKALANAKFGAWEFHVVGSGNPTKYIRLAEQLGVKDKVKFVGVLESGDQVFDWIDSLDIYIHPSRQEGLPRAIVEAMSRGCPILATGIAGIPELLQDEVLVKKNDWKALSTKLDNLIINEDLMAKLATRNFNKAKDYYDFKLDELRVAYFERLKNQALNQ
tara:strand:+ start:8976 stop:10154 length:1179 start_codon:yes stop_codon:yes gene_type:complete